jgi:hypothetical protein
MSDFSQQQPYTVTWHDDIPSLTSNDIQALTTADISSLGSLISNDTITLQNPHGHSYNYGSFGSTMAGNAYTTASGLTYVNTVGTVTLNTSQINSFSQISAIGTMDIRTLDTNWYVQPVEWVDNWPDFIKVKKMRDKYPALDKAMQKAISIYNMVKDDYDNPVPKK